MKLKEKRDNSTKQTKMDNIRKENNHQIGTQGNT
jgi:hypothetical protein